MKHDYPWIDFSQDYHSWESLLDSTPAPARNYEVMIQIFYGILSEKYPDHVRRLPRTELLGLAIGAILEFQPQLLANGQFVESPGKSEKQLNGSALRAIYELIVVQGIELPSVTLLLKTASKLMSERETNSGDTLPKLN